MTHHKQLQRTVTRRRGDGASAPFHSALAPRFTRQRAAAELRRYATRGPRSVFLSVTLFFLVACGGPTGDTPTSGQTMNAEISLETLEDFFRQMRDDYGWDIEGPLVWGYFFTDHDRDKLLAVGPALERMGYRLVGLLEPTQEDDDPGLLFLHVEKVERHTANTLFERNRVLYRFAEEHGLESYDGMDAGPVPQDH